MNLVNTISKPIQKMNNKDTAKFTAICFTWFSFIGFLAILFCATFGNLDFGLAIAGFTLMGTFGSYGTFAKTANIVAETARDKVRLQEKEGS